MADEGNPGGESPLAPPPSNGSGEKLFTQEQVNQIVQDRVARAKKDAPAAKVQSEPAASPDVGEQLKAVLLKVSRFEAIDQIERKVGYKLDDDQRNAATVFHAVNGSEPNFIEDVTKLISRMAPVKSEAPTATVTAAPEAKEKSSLPQSPPISDKGTASNGTPLEGVTHASQLTAAAREQMKATLGESAYLDRLQQIVKSSLKDKVRPV